MREILCTERFVGELRFEQTTGNVAFETGS